MYIFVFGIDKHLFSHFICRQPDDNIDEENYDNVSDEMNALSQKLKNKMMDELYKLGKILLRLIPLKSWN